MTKPDVLHHIGCSGGKDSSAVLIWACLESDIPRESIRVTFCDTGNEDHLTYEHVALLSERVCVANGVQPIETLMPERNFFELVLWKQRFPTRVAQFCTQHLKLEPTKKWLREQWDEDREVIMMTGKRAAESAQRANTVEWEPNGFFGAQQWNPLWNWSWDDVVELHHRHGIPLNPLYGQGAKRVGCSLCVNCGKRDLRRVKKHRPEKVEEIRGWECTLQLESGENRFYSFVPAKTVPDRFCSQPYISKSGEHRLAPTIDEAILWAHTSHGGRQQAAFFPEDEPEGNACWVGYQACE